MIRKKAFTLMELLVVIAIIALLMAIMMPALNKAKSIARNVLCQSNVRQLGLGLILYAQDNKNKLLPYVDPSIGYYWMEPISPYLEAKLEQGTDVALKVAFCPEASKVPDVTTVQTYGSSKTAWQMNYGKWKGSYGNNGWWFYDLDIAAPNYFGRMGQFIYRTFLEFKDDTPLFADAMWITGWADDAATPPPYPLEVCYSGFETFWVKRHGTGKSTVDVALAGGSVGRYEIGDLWTLPWRKDWKRQKFEVNW